MLYEPHKPENPPYLKSIDLYYLNHFWNDREIVSALKSFREKKPICWCCSGKGKVKDPTQRCVVEGMKYADLITCPRCGGSGIVCMETIHAGYKLEIDYYKQKLKKYRDDMTIYNSIVKKLDEEELEWLKKC